MSWAADVAFDTFAAQFDFSFASAQHFRQRHQSASLASMGEMLAILTKRLGR